MGGSEMIWLGLVVVVAMWIFVFWLLGRMLNVDDDPDERDPYN